MGGGKYHSLGTKFGSVIYLFIFKLTDYVNMSKLLNFSGFSHP